MSFLRSWRTFPVALNILSIQHRQGPHQALLRAESRKFDWLLLVHSLDACSTLLYSSLTSSPASLDHEDLSISLSLMHAVSPVCAAKVVRFPTLGYLRFKSDCEQHSKIPFLFMLWYGVRDGPRASHILGKGLLFHRLPLRTFCFDIDLANFPRLNLSSLWESRLALNLSSFCLSSLV